MKKTGKNKRKAIALLISFFLIGCVTVKAPTLPQIEYLEHPATTYYTESDFTFAFTDPVDKNWPVITCIEEEGVSGIAGTATVTVYLSQDGVFEFVGIITAGGIVERIGLSVAGQWATYDRFKDTDKFYYWSLDRFFEAHPDEREKIPIDKSHGI